LDIKLVYFKDSISNRSRDLFTLIKNAEIVHFFGAWTWVHVKTMIISILLRKKTVITPMGAFEEWSLSQKKFKKKLALFVYQKYFLKKSTLVHCTSEGEESNIKKINKQIKTVVLRHGLEGTEYKKVKIFNKKRRKMLFFSRIHQKKGISDVIKAWTYLKPKGWELDIIGPAGDNTINVIKKKIIQTKLNRKIFLKKPIFIPREKKELFKQYDVSILYSKNENFGYSILESLKHSLPVITTNNTPWKKIKTYNAGWYINYDFEALIKTLNKVFKIRNKELLLKSKNAFRLSKIYNWNKIIPEYIKMYKKLN